MTAEKVMASMTRIASKVFLSFEFMRFTSLRVIWISHVVLELIASGSGIWAYSTHEEVDKVLFAVCLGIANGDVGKVTVQDVSPMPRRVHPTVDDVLRCVETSRSLGNIFGRGGPRYLAFIQCRKAFTAIRPIMTVSAGQFVGPERCSLCELAVSCREWIEPLTGSGRIGQSQNFRDPLI